MFFKPKEHEPAHIHAIYGEYVGIFDIKTFDIIDGDLPQKAQGLVKEWLSDNHVALEKNVGYTDNCETQSIGVMIPKIKSIEPLSDYKLSVTFDDGICVVYDVMDDIKVLKDFEVLLSETGLFKNVQLDQSRTCIYWNDRVDLASDTILEYGIRQ